MGVLQRFERRLGGAVEGAFAKVFRGGVEPVEIAGALQREADDRKVISARWTRVPNAYWVELSDNDHQRLSPYAEALGGELAALVREHADDQGYTFEGPVAVTLELADDLSTGMFRVRSQVRLAQVAGPAPGPVRQPPSGSPGASARLVLTGRRGQPGLDFALGRAAVVIGRGSEADITVDDTGVSRRHAELRGEGDGHVLRDLGSTNGTSVNGHRLDGAVRLRDGDRVSVGSSALTYRLEA